MNRVTAFKLKAGGNKGFELTGTDFSAADSSNSIVYRDKVKREREFPIPAGIKSNVKSLAYPFLVYTDYWRSEYQPLMFQGHSAPNPDLLTNENEKEMTSLLNIWGRVKIIGCESSGDDIKIEGEIVFKGYSLKGKIVVSREDDHALYTFVEDAFVGILELLSSLIGKPQLDFSPNEISEVMESMNSNIDPDSDDDALLQMMKEAEKKGFGIVLDDKLLSQLSEHSESDEAKTESSSDSVSDEEEPPIEPEIASVSTKSDDLFEAGESVE